MTISPAELAHALRLPPPTSEQAAVIAAPLEPGVVVAGAGSGKTETMAARVVWLVANGQVSADAVLGLTFTRKAAAELAARIRRRLAQLRALRLGAGAGVGEGHREPTVSTYDAYAGRVVTEHALRLGIEPGARLVTEAVAWQLASRVVDGYDGAMDAVRFAPSTVTQQVLALHGELAGHLVEPAAVRQHAEGLLAACEALPGVPGPRGAHYAEVRDALAVQLARAQLLPLVEDFRRLKREQEVVDFADRAALAARLAGEVAAVGEGERSRFAVVLLDEYQDTSHAQLVLLRALFGGAHPVTAVGDPCQSIYGWRGASVDTLAAFGLAFPTAAGHPAPTRHLTTSFRNGRRVLAVANAVSEPLRGEGVVVPELRAGGLLAGTGPEAGTVVAALHLTADDEAADVARRARAYWDGASAGRPAPGRSAAVLVRTRAQIERLDAALRAAGLPVEVVGVGGLLATPEVADVVATLRVLADPARGDALVRLLTGARWRLGSADLDALGSLARRLARGPGAAAEEAASLVEALDALPRAGVLSAEGHRRAGRLAAELASLRARADQSLPDLVHDVERTCGLDVEAAARPDGAGRVHLDRLLEEASEFGAGRGASAAATLPAFLAYLDAGEAAERGLRPGEVQVSGERVQLLTVHAAKGLEWDAVFVVGLVDGTFPTGGSADRAWLGDPGQLPYPLRGDRSALPVLDLAGAADRKDLRDAVAAFTAQCGAAARLEERRLAYVAFTRARSLLVCSGYRWADGSRPLRPGPFLLEARAACLAGAGEVAAWVDDPGDARPERAVEVARWPHDPLGERRQVVEEAAAMVEAARRGTLDVDLETAAAAARWDRDVAVLLAERERARAGAGTAADVVLPRHLSVSQLVALRRDPAALARAIRRPVPLPPAPRARRGTAFHRWLEHRWRAPGLLDVDELPGSADDSAPAGADLAGLQTSFLASSWAGCTPEEVEAGFELPLRGTLVRGRVDAVFRRADGGIDIVDWKTGPPPVDGGEQAARAVQLAAYRLAFARLHDLPVERVGAAFHHVHENSTVRPVDLLDETGLSALLAAVPTALAAAGSLRDRRA